MAPVALWAALAVGLQLWAAGHGMPTQFTVNPNSPESGDKCQLTQYYDDRVQRCCSKCQPGHRVKAFCTESSDTVCTRCEDSTYTQLWNLVTECFSCGARCSHDQVETQACTLKQNRICMCKPGWYCMLKKQEGCRLCVPMRKCRPGFGVAKPAATPGNASMDTACASGFSPPQVALQPTSPPQPVATTSQHTEPTPGPSIKFSVPLLTGPSPPAEGIRTGSVSLPVGLIVGVTVFCLLIIGLVNVVILSQKKKKLSCLQREAKVPHVPADKARGEPGLEQQHLLTTAPSSSSSSLESSASATDRRTPTRSQPPMPSVDKAPGSGEAQASCRSSEPAPGGPGGPSTQVNVTCIVNVYSSSDPGSPCSSPAGPAMEDTDGSPSGLSMDDEQVPFSKEESPFESHPGPPETALQNPKKSLPLGVPDDGLKPS